MAHLYLQILTGAALCFTLGNAAAQTCDKDAVRVTNRGITTDGVRNFKVYEVDAPEKSNYDAEFWLCPSLHRDGQYTSYIVLCNGIPIGTVTPTQGNWQVASMTHGVQMPLSKGSNIIAIGALKPEIPNIEAINFSTGGRKQAISSDAYDNYVERARNANDTYPPMRANIPTVSPNLFNELNFSDVPLQYSFYATYTFDEGDEIDIKSQSPMPHNIDVTYLGQYIMETVPVPGSGVITGALQPVWYGSSQLESQGLSWRGPSEIGLTSYQQEAKVHMRVTKDGVYLVRLRCMGNGELGLADLNVNDSIYTNGVPISYNSIPVVIPDSISYTCSATTSFPSRDKAILFVQGAAGERIVGVSNILNNNIFLLAPASVSESYFIPTTAIDVISSTSLNPESTCNVKISRDDDFVISPPQMVRANDAAEILPITISDENLVQLKGTLHKGGDITVLSCEPVSRVSAYDLAGRLIGTVSAHENEVNVPLSTLNINMPGVYLIQVHPGQNNSVKKILVR